MAQSIEYTCLSPSNWECEDGSPDKYYQDVLLRMSAAHHRKEATELIAASTTKAATAVGIPPAGMPIAIKPFLAPMPAAGHTTAAEDCTLVI